MSNTISPGGNNISSVNFSSIISMDWMGGNVSSSNYGLCIGWICTLDDSVATYISFTIGMLIAFGLILGWIASEFDHRKWFMQMLFFGIMLLILILGSGMLVYLAEFEHLTRIANILVQVMHGITVMGVFTLVIFMLILFIKSWGRNEKKTNLGF